VYISEIRHQIKTVINVIKKR